MTRWVEDMNCVFNFLTLLLTLENKLHIFVPPLNILYVFKSGYKIFMHSPPQFRSTLS